MNVARIDRLLELQAEATDKLQGLRRSLELQALVSDAFAYGACRSWLQGRYRDPKRLELVVERGDKSQVVFPFLSLPIAVQLRYLPELKKPPRRFVNTASPT